MNRRQKQVAAAALRSEAEVIKDLRSAYEQARLDIEMNIKLLMTDELTQSRIYQLDYQNALKKQVDATIDMMDAKNYTTVQAFLKDSYEDGFIGTMFDLQGQGVPLLLALDQEQIAKAVSLTGDEIKLSKKLYDNTAELKKKVRNEIARGLSTGASYQDMARNLKSHTNANFNRAIRIARTEGHRVQASATYDAQIRAKEKGADVVKQWDSTMDSSTREDHVYLDGQIRELDEPFEVGFYKAKHPGGFGVAAEDVNCRCTLLQRARWGIANEEFTKRNGDTGELVRLKEKDYRRFKEAYKKL